MRKFPLITLFVLLLAFGSSSALAQSGYSVCGTLTDPSGAAVSAAPLQLLTDKGARIADATSSLSGAFEFRLVASGAYLIKVPSFDGFALKSIAIRVPLHSAGLVIKLEPDRVVQVVSVEDNHAISTDPTANKDAVSYRAEDLRSIPIFDQDVLGALTPFLDAGSISSGGVSIVVDGVEMKGDGIFVRDRRGCRQQ